MIKLRLIGLSLLLLSGCAAQNQQADKKPAANQSVPQTKNKETKSADSTTPPANPDKKTADPATAPTNTDKKVTPPSTTPVNTDTKTADTKKKPTENNSKGSEGQKPPANSKSSQKDDSIHVVAQPASIPVLVNKQNKLPDSYNPPDLVTTTVPFINSATSEKRKMRKEAAAALAQLFAGANQQGVKLLGVSAYRSHATQTSLFNYYVKNDGYEKARTYSALPGTSEHETGLAIDVTGGDGKCAADDCFGGTTEAKWLQSHSAEYGFIIRYPQGKESITGYKYEPWHIRYVGKEIATKIMSAGITLEEYYHTTPVNN